MSDFHQNGIITTLHNFNNLSKKTIEEEYKKLEIKQQSFLNNEKKFNSVEDIEGLSYELHEIIID